MIAIVDYDIGNLAAVANMFKRVGAKSIVTADPSIVLSADRIVLPGNGAFDSCMQALRETGLVPVLEKRVLRDKVPLLAICVGAQMLGRGSEEGAEEGLGWVPMTVRRFPDGCGKKIPHMGWCSVENARMDDPILQQMETNARYYFVHSFFMDPDNPDDVLLRANYGISFAAAVRKENVLGVQFHPEKSHKFGMRMMAAFSEWQA